jgi:hypothetical protein
MKSNEPTPRFPGNIRASGEPGTVQCPLLPDPRNLRWNASPVPQALEFKAALG